MSEKINDSLQESTVTQSDEPHVHTSNRNIIVIAGIILLTALLFGFTIKEKKEEKPQAVISPSAVTNTPIPSQTVRKIALNKTTYPIAVPFIRDGSLYVYKNGKEELIDLSDIDDATDARKSCFRFTDPMTSPDGNYIAYMKEGGEREEYSNVCNSKQLYLYNVSSGKKSKIPYIGSSMSWNINNQLNIESYSYTQTSDGESIEPEQSFVTYLVYDPVAGKTLQSVKVNVLENDKAFRGFVISSNGKSITFENETYFLNNEQNDKIKLFDGAEISAFRGWSPEGTYAIFDTTKTAYTPDNSYALVWNIVDTTSDKPKVLQMPVLQGAAGGEPSVGTQWFFEKGFVSYCSSHLSLLSGETAWELATDGGGGCHNEDGFVATSPDSQYAIVKKVDRFVLYTRGGDGKKIDETTQIYKGRSAPARIQWITNDYAVIYESNINYSPDSNEKPLIFLFDRATMKLEPIIENGYLETYDYPN